MGIGAKAEKGGLVAGFEDAGGAFGGGAGGDRAAAGECRCSCGVGE